MATDDSATRSSAWKRALLALYITAGISFLGAISWMIYRSYLIKDGQVQYTLSRTYNNTSGITFFPANSYNPAADWNLSDNDRLHKFDLLASSQPTRFFTLGLALSLYSGKPVDITTGGDDNHDGILNDRPSGVARNSMAGPGTIDLDLNLSHDFPLTKKKEAKVLSISLNSFNVLNHPNYVTYIGTISSPLFGRPAAAQPPRRMQLDVQFKF